MNYEGDKLFAEFMGAKFRIIDNNKYFRDTFLVVDFEDKSCFELDQLKYDSSWDWLMPVCKKFDSLDFSTARKATMLKYEDFCDGIDNAVTLYEIEPVFIAVTAAVKWYMGKFINKKTVPIYKKKCNSINDISNVLSEVKNFFK